MNPIVEIEDDIQKYWFDENGILNSYIKKEILLDLSTCQKLIEMRHKISAGEKQYWLYDFKNIKGMPAEGKEFADKYGQDYLHASAALVHNHLQKYIVNIFIAIKKPKIPFRAFTDRTEATNWLLKQRKLNESKRD